VDHPSTIPAKFGLICYSSFRGQDLNVKVYDIRQMTDGCQVMGKTHMIFDIFTFRK